MLYHFNFLSFGKDCLKFIITLGYDRIFQNILNFVLITYETWFNREELKHVIFFLSTSTFVYSTFAQMFVSKHDV